MSSNDIVIRHVRLCSCGKVAGHNSICRQPRNVFGQSDDVERVPAAVEDEFAERRRARFNKRAQAFSQSRREQRANMSLGQLMREALIRQARLSTVRAGAIEPSRGGGDAYGPPMQQMMEDDPRIREHQVVIRSRLERWLELLDEAQGHGTIGHTGQMLTEEKDRLVLAEEGLTPLAVVEKLGHDIAGSPLTVKRIRRGADRDPSTGYRREGHIDAPLRLVPNSNRQSVVYFIQAADEPDGPIKIGHSDRLDERMQALQIGSPMRLRLLGTLPGGRALESRLHRIFAADRRHGEWFTCSDRLLGIAKGKLALPETDK